MFDLFHGSVVWKTCTTYFMSGMLMFGESDTLDEGFHLWVYRSRKSPHYVAFTNDYKWNRKEKKGEHEGQGVLRRVRSYTTLLQNLCVSCLLCVASCWPILGGHVDGPARRVFLIGGRR